VTWQEASTSLKQLYRKMMFPKEPHAPKWTMTEIDQLDVHFFSELMEVVEDAPQEKEVYLSDIWG